MSNTLPYIPPAVLRKNVTGSYKMRLSIEINPKFCQKRIQLGLGTKNRSEAEEIAIAACRLFMKTGLCSRPCLRLIHETEKEEFFLLTNEQACSQTTSLSKNLIVKYDFRRPPKSGKIPVYKEKGEYKFSFSLTTEKSPDQRNFTFNTKKEKKKTAMKLAAKIIPILTKAYSHTIPPIRLFCLNKKKRK